MQLPGALRHVFAVLLGSAAFLALYLSAGLVWWLALALAAVVFGATLIVIRERPSATDVMVAPRVSLADLRNAGAQLQTAAREMEALVPAVPPRSQAALTSMAEGLTRLAGQVAHDPEDFRKTRRFVSHFLPHILQNTRDYAALAAKAGGTGARLNSIGARIESYAPTVQRINQACLENDFDALEAEVSALDHQFSRRPI